MAYKVIILYQLYMPSYFLGTFTEYPYIKDLQFVKIYLITRFLHHKSPTKSPSIYHLLFIIYLCRYRENRTPAPEPS